MAISFFTYSKKDTSPLWIRYREGKIDAKTRTPLVIQTDRLVKGQIVKHRIKQSDNADQKSIIRDKNKALDSLQIKMNELQRMVQNALNERDGTEIIDKNWIKGVVYPDKNDNLLVNHIESFLTTKKLTVKPNSYKLYCQIKRVVEDFEAETKTKYLLKNVDLKFADSFKEWLKASGYSNNSIRNHIGVLVQVLKFAKKRKYSVSNDLEFFKDGLKSKKTLNVYLSFDEIDKISKLDDLSDSEVIARDWLVISCYTAQRASDMFSFNSKALSKDSEWLTVQQTKNDTSAKILVPIMPQVRAILNKYNGQFPPVFEINNYFRYLRNIKTVCKKAGLNELTKTLASKGGGDGSKVTDKEKWELIGSHIGRRSFATNFYGKIPTALIMSITGHLTESSFLMYINRERIIDREKLMSQLIGASLT